MGAEEKQAVLDVLDSGMIACGSIVSEFEKEFAAYLGTEHCIATTSGTTALEVGLRALGGIRRNRPGYIPDRSGFHRKSPGRTSGNQSTADRSPFRPGLRHGRHYGDRPQTRASAH